jgi:CheY-like chemotaxis protein
VRPTLTTYAGAYIALLAAVGLRQLLDPLLADNLPFITLYPVVAAAACLGSYLAPTVVASAGYLVCQFLFQTQRGTLDPSGTKELLALIEYLFVCSLLVAAHQWRRRADRTDQRALNRPRLQHETVIARGRSRNAEESEPLEAKSAQSAPSTYDRCGFLGLCDASGVPFYVNAHGLELAGLQSIEEAQRMHLCDMFIPEDRARVMNEWFPTAIEKGQSDMEVRLRNARDGAARTMAFKMLALADASGRIAGFAAIGEEAARRRRHDACAPFSDGRFDAMTEALPRLRILVADDNREVAVALARLLRVHGHKTLLAHDGAAALETAHTHRPDVALLDLEMPVLDGHEACRQLRRHPSGSEMVVIAVTGTDREEDRRRCREAGFDGHLSKPAEYADLAALIASALQARGRSRVSERLDRPPSRND